MTKLEQEISQRKFRNPKHKLTVNIIYTYGWLNSQHIRIFKSHGITSQQYNVLRILRGRYPLPATIKLLKERMLDKMSDASRIVEKLRRKGLVTRLISKQDRRHCDVFISKSGLKLLSILDGRAKDFDQFLKKLSAKEVEQLNGLLDKIRW